VWIENCFLQTKDCRLKIPRNTRSSVLDGIGEIESRQIWRLSPLGAMTGFCMVKHSRSCGCTAKIIFLSFQEDRDSIRAAFDVGGFRECLQVSTDALPTRSAFGSDPLWNAQVMGKGTSLAGADHTNHSTR